MNSEKTTSTTKGSANEKIAKAMELVNQAREQKMDETKATINETISKGKKQAKIYADQANQVYHESKEATEKSISHHPFTWLAGAGIIGLILGFLFSSSKKRS